jgi:hypothetical protein
MKGIRLVVIVCAALAAMASAAGLSPVGVRATRPDSTVTVTSTSHGLKITLSVPRATYPENALVATTITVKNISAQAVDIVGAGCLPIAWTEVLDKHGNSYPTPITFHPPSCGPHRRPMVLKPGAVVSTTSIVVLRSGSLRTDLRITSGESGQVDVPGDVLALTLVQAAAEHVALTSGTPGHPDAGFTASVWPVPKAAGSLYITSWQSCRQANGNGEDTGSFPYQWQTATGSILHTTILHPSCVTQTWQFAAGWLGYPVAKLNLGISAT